jgi:hypothetical protein
MDMEFDHFLDQAWADHAEHPAAVAERLHDRGVALATTPQQVSALAHLAHHVMGEHLGRWRDGIALQQRFAALLASRGDVTVAQALRRFIASLALAAGGQDLRAGLGDSDRLRVTALAAASLAGHDAARALALLQQALADAQAAGLPDTDPYARALAVAGNNLACTLEEKAARTPAERELMILAAQAARRYWALAGTWLETERAEYRLAMSWLQAGDPAQARQHAAQCLALVQENDGPALERFFAWEAIGVAARAAGDSGAHIQALAQARQAFAKVGVDERRDCQSSLDGLAATP